MRGSEIMDSRRWPPRAKLPSLRSLRPLLRSLRPLLRSLRPLLRSLHPLLRSPHPLLRSLLPLLLPLLLSSCSNSFFLDRSLEPGPSDWLQQGGDAGRRHVATQAMAGSNSLRHPVGAVSEERAETEQSFQPTPDSVATELLWEFDLDGMSSTSAPLLVDRAVIFSSTTGMAEAVELHSGERVGRFPCTWFIHGTPAIADGCLFVATNGIEPLLLCFDLRARRIRYETPIPSVHASLCAVQEGVIMAARHGEVARFTPRDSVALWTIRIEGAITAAPAAADSLLLVAAQNGDLSAHSLRDGATHWRFPTAAAFLADPSVANGLVVAVNSVGTAVGVDLHHGTERWRREFGEPVYQGSARRGDTIAIALSGGDVVLLREADGAELARWRTRELPGAAPLFVDGTILQLQRRGVLLAIDLRSGAMTEVYRLDTRSASAPLLTDEGVVLVSEEGEAVCVRGWKDGRMEGWKGGMME